MAEEGHVRIKTVYPISIQNPWRGGGTKARTLMIVRAGEEKLDKRTHRRISVKAGGSVHLLSGEISDSLYEASLRPINTTL